MCVIVVPIVGHHSLGGLVPKEKAEPLERKKGEILEIGDLGDYKIQIVICEGRCTSYINDRVLKWF